MKDFRGNDLTVGDEVYVASVTGTGSPVMEHCVVEELLLMKEDGTPRKKPMVMLRVVDSGATGNMTADNAEKRIGRIKE